jgi:hypothetical protein
MEDADPLRAARPRAAQGVRQCARSSAVRKEFGRETGLVHAVNGVDLDVSRRGLDTLVRVSRPDDAGLVGQDHSLDPVTQPELGKKIRDV